MYGDRVFEAVIEAGETESGVSVHIVDGDFDAGRVVRQCKVPVFPGDSSETLKTRVRMREREFVVEILADIARGALVLDDADDHEHWMRLTVDGTLLEAWASQKSFQRKDGDTDGDGRHFRGQDRKNDTQASTTDPDARLYRKSDNAEARLAYLGHLLMENRHGLIVDAQATVDDKNKPDQRVFYEEELETVHR